MNPLEIVLIVIGIIIIIISCRLVDRSQKESGKVSVNPFSFDQDISQEDKKKLMERLEGLLSNLSDETIIQTDDILSKLSNEKIMAVSEFSDQILEKIKRNHEEVVFLYNMLNDKEKELKAAVTVIDQSKKKVQDIIETKINNETLQNSKAAKNHEKHINQASGLDSTSKVADTQALFDEVNTVIDSLNVNSNSNILSLYSQGKTVVEISKLLGLGQGEVKLVIDLYKGKK